VTDEIVDAEVVGTELVPAEPQQSVTLFRTDDPVEVVEKASRVADALKDVLTRQGLTKRIGSKDHVLVEGWTTLGSMLGVVPVCVWTRKVDDGWEARVEARTLDGRTVGAAEAECLKTENTWKSRDDYALRSMAQTRATSKALRGPLGFIVTLAGFVATPAEEMPADGSGGRPPTTLDRVSDKQIKALAGKFRRRQMSRGEVRAFLERHYKVSEVEHLPSRGIDFKEMDAQLDAWNAEPDPDPDHPTDVPVDEVSPEQQAADAEIPW
jgi:hypothetical protein